MVYRFQYILAQGTNGDFQSQGFLRNIPENIQSQNSNLIHLLKQCSEPDSTQTRIDAGLQLQKILDEIVKNHPMQVLFSLIFIFYIFCKYFCTIKVQFCNKKRSTFIQYIYVRYLNTVQEILFKKNHRTTLTANNILVSDPAQTRISLTDTVR